MPVVELYDPTVALRSGVITVCAETEDATAIARAATVRCAVPRLQDRWFFISFEFGV
jgi:hypothetical protein